MTYNEFVAEYEKLLKVFLDYEFGDIGCYVYADKIADLVDAFPKYEQIYEANLYPTG